MMDGICKLDGSTKTLPCAAPNCPLYGDCVAEWEKITKKTVTNADRIRAMSDGELARELMTWRLDAVARNHGIEGVYPDTQKEILKWLHQPAKEDT